MIPILFSPSETSFTSNGIGRLAECLSCVVTEERNGIYECEFTYPINGKWYSQLVSGGIIGVIHDDNHDIQPFDIYKYSAPVGGVVTFNACHISYRLNDIVTTPFTATSASAALAAVKTNSANTNPFTFTTDYTGTKTYELGFMRSARGVLLGEEGSILQSWHGEYKFDKFNVSLLQNRGSDTGVTVRYGKNILDITREADNSGTFNAIAPYWTDGTVTVTLPEVYVQPTTPITPIKVKTLDMSTDFETQPTEAQLRTAAVAYLDGNKPWEGFDSIEIDFVALWQTPEYEDVAEIQRVGLCDTVSVYWTDAGIVAEKIKVVRTEYNVLTERFNKLHLGQISSEHVETTGDQATGNGGTSTKATFLSIGSADTGITRYGYVAYHPASSTVKVYLSARNTSANIPTTAVIGTIPEGYRPSSNANIPGFFVLADGSAHSYRGVVRTDGTISQSFGSAVREMLLVGEYTL